MEERLVTFETAKLITEKGFDYRCPVGYSHTGDDKFDGSTWGYFVSTQKLNGSVHAPTQGLVQKWFRDKHKLEVLVMMWRGKWTVSIYELSSKKVFGSGIYEGSKGYKSYEDALEVGISEALKLI